jgi:hypothetical protein
MTPRRLLSVTFQHPTPYYDDSYAVNSANNGPYGDALTQELIPYYLNLAVYLLEDTMKGLDQPRADATFEYGRPMKGHGWQPISNADLVRMMADRIDKTAPGTVARR